MKKTSLAFFLLIAPCSSAQDDSFVFTGSMEELAGECIDEDGDIDFDRLLSPEYDPDNPEVLRPRQKRPVEYIPPILRTIGFEVFRRYIALHNAIKTKISSFWAYIRNKVVEARSSGACLPSNELK